MVTLLNIAEFAGKATLLESTLSPIVLISSEHEYIFFGMLKCCMIIQQIVTGLSTLHQV